jgi:hypothetical protein
MKKRFKITKEDKTKLDRQVGTLGARRNELLAAVAHFNAEALTLWKAVVEAGEAYNQARDELDATVDAMRGEFTALFDSKLPSWRIGPEGEKATEWMYRLADFQAGLPEAEIACPVPVPVRLREVKLTIPLVAGKR